MLVALENKLVQLIVKIKKLKEYNRTLVSENGELRQKLNMLELQIKEGTEDIKELVEEKASIKVSIDNLIENIDSFIEDRS